MNTLVHSGYAPVNGLQMYYEIHGSGEMPLVLIHGGGSTIDSNFGVLLPLLAKTHRILAVELQAHGRTSDREGPESFEQDADDVVALLQHLKIEKVNILGFSNGGTTTMQIAIRRPEVVNKLIIASANYKREGLIPQLFEFMPQATLDMMPAPLREAYLSVAPNKENLIVMFTKDKERMINFKDIPDDLIRSIKAPTLLINADQDVVTTEHVVAMSRLLPNVRLVVLPGTHGTYLGEACSIKEGSKQPEMTAQLVEEFLADQ